MQASANCVKHTFGKKNRIKKIKKILTYACGGSKTEFDFLG